ncbi:sensor domain-containing diguanylate cyclase [Thomasclavelia sp.]
MTKEEIAWQIICCKKMIAYISDRETYELKFLTPAAMEVCNITKKEQYFNKKCYEFLQGSKEPCAFCTNNKLSLDNEYKWEYFNNHLGFWVNVEDSLLCLDGKMYRLETIQNISKTKEEIKELSNRLSKEEVLNKCIELLAYEKNMDVAIDRFLDTLGNFYAADRAYIFEYDFENKCANNTYEWCKADIVSEKNNLQNLPFQALENWEIKFKRDGWFYLDSIADYYSPDSIEYKIINPQGIHSIAVVPFFQNDKIVGFLGVDNPSINLTDWALLQSVSTFIVDEIGKRRLLQELTYMSQRDFLTGLKNRNSYQRFLEELKLSLPKSLGIVFIDINGLKKANDKHGHRYGDHLIVKTANIINQFFYDCSYRIGGDEFIILIDNCKKIDFERKIKEMKILFEQDDDVDVSIGFLWQDGEYDLESIIISTDELMYAEKEKYYKREINAL